MGQKEHNVPWLRLGAALREAQPTRARQEGCALLEAPPGAARAHYVRSGPKKPSWSFVAFGLRLILISCDVKNMQKTTTGTSHYVNRLVPKMI